MPGPFDRQCCPLCAITTEHLDFRSYYQPFAHKQTILDKQQSVWFPLCFCQSGGGQLYYSVVNESNMSLKGVSLFLPISGIQSCFFLLFNWKSNILSCLLSLCPKLITNGVSHIIQFNRSHGTVLIHLHVCPCLVLFIYTLHHEPLLHLATPNASVLDVILGCSITLPLFDSINNQTNPTLPTIHSTTHPFAQPNRHNQLLVEWHNSKVIYP